MRFFDSPSNEEVDESSSSGGRVNRSNIAGGSTAPNDKIRFPPLLFTVCDLEEILVVIFWGSGCAAAAVAVAGVFALALLSSWSDDDDDEEDSSLPYPFNRSMVVVVVVCYYYLYHRVELRNANDEGQR